MSAAAAAAAAATAGSAATSVDESEVPRVVLELGASHGDMWLVKVPHGELAAAIQAAIDGEVIGSVVVRVSECRVTLAMAVTVAVAHSAVSQFPLPMAATLVAQLAHALQHAWRVVGIAVAYTPVLQCTTHCSDTCGTARMCSATITLVLLWTVNSHATQPLVSDGHLF
jgi:hypothetical protein